MRHNETYRLNVKYSLCTLYRNTLNTLPLLANLRLVCTVCYAINRLLWSNRPLRFPVILSASASNRLRTVRTSHRRRSTVGGRFINRIAEKATYDYATFVWYVQHKTNPSLKSFAPAWNIVTPIDSNATMSYYDPSAIQTYVVTVVINIYYLNRVSRVIHGVGLCTICFDTFTWEKK